MHLNKLIFANELSVIAFMLSACLISCKYFSKSFYLSLAEPDGVQDVSFKLSLKRNLRLSGMLFIESDIWSIFLLNTSTESQIFLWKFDL